MQDAVAARVWQLAEPVVSHEGMEIVDVEFRREARGAVLRLYLDRDGGVNLDDLTRVSRQLGDLLDVHNAVPGKYTLECSSPGIRRRLRLPAHFAKFIGGKIRVRLAHPVAGRKTFVGVLRSAGPEEITIEEPNGVESVVRYADIGHANYEPDDLWGGTPCNPN